MSWGGLVPNIQRRLDRKSWQQTKREKCNKKRDVKHVKGSEIVIELDENKVNKLPDITRVEVIEDGYRKYVNWKVTDVMIAIQDGGKTLKIFTKEKKEKQ